MVKLKNKIKVNTITIDIETYPSKVLIYGNTYEPIVVKILSFEKILSMSYKLNNEKTKYVGLNTIKGYKKGNLNDKKLLIEISKIFNSLNSDFYIVGHNSDSFDITKIKERILFHRLPPLQDLPSLDTKKLYKKVSKLPNNKLNTISQFMGNGSKIEHSGVSLFMNCGKGDMKAWKVNEKYNTQDVDITYKDLVDVMPYVKASNIYSRANADITCSNPLCLSTHVIKRGVRRVLNGYRQQYQCKKCGHYQTDNRLIK